MREHELNNNFYDSFNLNEPIDTDWDDWSYDDFDYWHDRDDDYGGSYEEEYEEDLDEEEDW
jgi:hypothetical protein